MFQKHIPGKGCGGDGIASLNEIVIRDGMFVGDFIKDKDPKERHVEMLTWEEIYWRDKAQVNWLSTSDKNIKKFHKFVRVRLEKNIIEEIKLPNGMRNKDL